MCCDLVFVQRRIVMLELSTRILDDLDGGLGNARERWVVS